MTGRLKIAIPVGDPAGIGPEIALKAALDPGVRAACDPILVCDQVLLERHAKACELALAQLASKRFPLEKVTTHKFGLKDVDLAIRSVGGQGVPDVIHASLMPWK